MTIEAPKLQSLMDVAYDRFQENRNWTKKQFWAQLSDQERRAVFVGNLNQQVTNGGFCQWIENRYGTEETFDYLIALCDELGTPSSIAVKGLLRKIMLAAEAYSEAEAEGMLYYEGDRTWQDLYDASEEYSTDFYKVNEAFVEDVEKTLRTEQK